MRRDRMRHKQVLQLFLVDMNLGIEDYEPIVTI